MYDELTKSDLKKMQEEIDYRVQTLRPKLIEDVQTARAFGDLSENFEYKCAKQEKNRNDARVRYLQRMIKTAHVIDDTSAADAAARGLRLAMLSDYDSRPSAGRAHILVVNYAGMDLSRLPEALERLAQVLDEEELPCTTN